MNKRLTVQLILFLIFILILVIGIGYISSPSTIKAERLYVEYLETSKISGRDAFEYLHFENPFHQELAFQCSDTKIFDYEILAVDQLTNKLWAFTCHMSSDIVPEGMTIFNFVGSINGKLYVMTNASEIPADLKESLDLSKYLDPNALDFSDIIIY